MKQYRMTVSENYQNKNSLSHDRITAKLKKYSNRLQESS